MKRSKRKWSGHDAPNLKRFRAAVVGFVEHQSNTPGDHEHLKSSEPPVPSVKTLPAKPRKARRKDARRLKKARRDAYRRKQELPTVEGEEQKRQEKVQAARKRKEKREKDKRRRQRKREQSKNMKADPQEIDHRVQGLLEANKQEDKLIRQLAKQMKLNKRKKLPQAFHNDGLDYILDAVDHSKLPSILEDSGDEEDGVLRLVPQSDSEAGSDTDEEDGELDDSDIPESHSDEESEDTDSGLKSGVKGKHKLRTIKDEISGVNRSVPKKAVRFENPGEKDGANKTKTSSMKGLSKRTSTSSEGKLTLKGKGQSKLKGDEDEGVSEEDEGVSEEDEGVSEDSEGVSEQDEGVSEDSERVNEEVEGVHDEELAGDSLSEDSDPGNPQEAHKAAQYKEDIYGRLRDEQGKIVHESPGSTSGAYIPPAKRHLLASKEGNRKAQLERLRKQLKGLINRLSESNLQPISSQIEQLYRTYSRADVTEVLTDVILNVCVSPVATPERLVMEHMLLLAVLHCKVGSEVGGVFLQTWVKQFEALYLSGAAPWGESKEVDNLVSVLSHLYNFKVIHCLLVYDIIHKFTDNFGEKEIELLLLILKNVGFSLRKDDPSALKECMIRIQQQASIADPTGFTDQSRMKFMLEILMAVRNNNMRKIPNYDPTQVEHLGKILRSYTKGSGSGESQLRISLADLLTAEESGRWWVVGSAWENRLTDKPASSTTSTSMVSQVSSKILELARKQRMNTEVRKNIFCVLMTSEDFVDAFEKLLRLGLKQQQEREIIHVMVDVCLQETAYNPYYTYLAHKFCQYDRRFQMTMQFMVWDKLKILSDMSAQQCHHLAAMITHLVATKALSLSVFKVLEFSELDKSKVRFLRQVLTALLTDHEPYTVTEVFQRIAPFPKLHMLREGLKLFMKHFLLKGKGKDTQTLELLRTRVEVAEKALNSTQSQMKL